MSEQDKSVCTGNACDALLLRINGAYPNLQLEVRNNDSRRAIRLVIVWSTYLGTHGTSSTLSIWPQETKQDAVPEGQIGIYKYQADFE